MNNIMANALTVKNYNGVRLFKSFYSQSQHNIMVNVPDRHSGHQGSIPGVGIVAFWGDSND